MASSRSQESSPARRGGLRTFLLYALIAAVAFVAVCAVLARGPDRQLSFGREVPVQASPETVERAMSALVNWPKWFHALTEARRVDILGRAMPAKDQVLENGAMIEFHVDPKKGFNRKFEVLAQVTDYVPGKRLGMRVLRDSSGRLTRLFDRIEWRVEYVPAENGKPARLRGSETALTRHWRSRLFGTISERILMNQIFYPDLIKLAEFKQPLSPVPLQNPGQ